MNKVKSKGSQTKNQAKKLDFCYLKTLHEESRRLLHIPKSFKISRL